MRSVFFFGNLGEKTLCDMKSWYQWYIIIRDHILLRSRYKQIITHMYLAKLAERKFTNACTIFVLGQHFGPKINKPQTALTAEDSKQVNVPKSQSENETYTLPNSGSRCDLYLFVAISLHRIQLLSALSRQLVIWTKKLWFGFDRFGRLLFSMQPETSLGVSCERQQLPFSFLPQLGDRWRGVTVLLLFTQGIQFSEDALRDHGRQHRLPPLLCSSAS